VKRLINYILNSNPKNRKGRQKVKEEPKEVKTNKDSNEDDDKNDQIDEEHIYISDQDEDQKEGRLNDA